MQKLRPAIPARALAVACALALAAGCTQSDPAAAPAAAVPATASNGATPSGKLHQSGRWLLDDANRVVILHGVSFVAKLPPYLPSKLGFGDDDAAFIASQGFNTVRLGLIHKGLAPQPGVYDDAYLDDLLGTVRTLEKHGIYVLFDFHQDLYNERYQGEGLADWATVDSAPTDPTNTPNCAAGFPGNIFVCEFMWEAFDRFFGINGRSPEAGPRGMTLQDEYAEAWRHVAAKLRDEPLVFGYDLFNEPYPGTATEPCLQPTGCPLDLDAKLTAFHARVAKAIREVDGGTIVFYEPWGTNFNAGMPTAEGDIGTTNVGFSFHVYACPSSLVPAQASPLPAQVTQACGPLAEDTVYTNADSQAAKQGVAPLVSEFGATDDYATIARIADLADKHLDGWQYWAWWGRDPCCERPTEGIIDDPANPPTAGHLDAQKLDVLVRAFPRAIAGTPTSWSWDAASRTFAFTYSTSAAAGAVAAGAATEIWVPRRQFPDGYVVHVSGAHAISPPGAELLQLVADRGATDVSVTVAPP